MNEATQQGVSEEEFVNMLGAMDDDDIGMKEPDPAGPGRDTRTESSEEEQDDAVQETRQETSAEKDEDVLELTVADIAEVFGVKETDFTTDESGKPLVKVKVNGKEEYLPFDDVRNGYQMATAAQKGLEDLNASKQQFDMFAAQQAQVIGHNMQVASALLEQAEQMIVGDYNQVNWDELRQNDPAEFSAKQTEFQTRMNYVNGQKQQLAGFVQHQMQEQERMMVMNHQSMLAREREALDVAIPEWRDVATRTAERKAIKDYLGKEGFSEVERSSVVDHRHVKIARKAMLYDQMMSQKDTAQQKLDTAPRKRLRPGPVQGKRGRDISKNAELRKKVIRGGSANDFQKYLESLL